MLMGRCLLISGTALLATAGAWAAETIPVTVSPGSPTGTRIGQVCPTFSWGGVEGVETYELIVLRLDEPTAIEAGIDPEATSSPALRARIPGAASSWTPSLDRCLEDGHHYAWLVRGLSSGGEAGDWSAPYVFEIVLRSTDYPRHAEVAGTPSNHPAAASAARPRSVPTHDESALSRHESLVELPRPFAARFPSGIGASILAGSTQGSFAGTAISGELLPGHGGWAVLGFDTGGQATGVVGISGTSGVAASFGAPIGVWGQVGEPGGPGGYAVLGENSANKGWGGLFESFEPGGRGVGAFSGSGNDLALVVGNRLGDDGLIGSAPWEPSSDIIFITNDAVAVRLDQNKDGEDADFEISDKDGALVFNVDESGTIRLKATDSPDVCTASTAGSVYFDLSLGDFCLCRGNGWKQLSGGADC